MADTQKSNLTDAARAEVRTAITIAKTEALEIYRQYQNFLKRQEGANPPKKEESKPKVALVSSPDDDNKGGLWWGKQKDGDE